MDEIGPGPGLRVEESKAVGSDWEKRTQKNKRQKWSTRGRSECPTRTLPWGSSSAPAFTDLHQDPLSEK